MKAYCEMTKEQLEDERQELTRWYGEFKKKGLKLDMSRGKPAPVQVGLSKGILDVLQSSDTLVSDSGVDCGNYGILDGILEAKELMAGMMGVTRDSVIVYGNSSLNVMYDTISRSMIHGVLGHTPWCRLERVKFLCPCPGYDRHFAITQSFGIELIPVSMREDGPDLDLVERLVREDRAIKGIWCVPLYSNPQGISYSDEIVRRLANLKPAAGDFRIYWDNAYSIHHLYEDRQDRILNILEECRRAGNPDLVYLFASTAKVSFPGAGIAALAASEANLAEIKAHLSVQTIGHDKLNQLRHVKYFRNLDEMKIHMRKHAAILRPKFQAALETLEQELGGRSVGSWRNPNGGYFISFETLDGCASEVVRRCREAGVILTNAGATYPYGKDEKDSNIRLAPSYPSVEELKLAMKLFTLCVKLVTLDKILENKQYLPGSESTCQSLSHP